MFYSEINKDKNKLILYELEAYKYLMKNFPYRCCRNHQSQQWLNPLVGQHPLLIIAARRSETNNEISHTFYGIHFTNLCLSQQDT